jgi:NAD(P)-dependent dehydrogenase (short-subunit alcohol dehydrogenase family)
MFYPYVLGASNAIHTTFSALFSLFGITQSYKQHHNGVIIMSGSSTGIGADATLQLANQGFIVVAGVRKEADGKRLIEQAGKGKIVPLILDVTNVQQVKDAVVFVQKLCKEESLPFVGLVCNAGVIGPAGPIEATSEQDMHYLYDVNIFGVTRMVQAFGAMLRKSQGRIIVVGSMGGIVSTPGIGPYSSSKFVMESLCDSMRGEYGPFNVNVSLIEPGSIKTEIWGKGQEQTPYPNPATDPSNPWSPFMLKLRALASNAEGAAVTPDVSTGPAIVHAMTARYPKTRYVVGMDAIIVTTLRRWLPDRLWDKVIRGQLGW